MSLAPGTRLDAYEVVDTIGAGAMGEVYRARDTRLDRDVALKVLPEAFARDPDRLARFEVEAKTLAALSHPNILGVFDLGTHDGQPYLTLELLKGETLREKLDAGALPTSKAIDYARQTALGLSAAHASGITHRDIKPENLFVTTDGRVKILDFGLAKLAAAPTTTEDETQLETGTAAGVVLGTVGYMSPEQVRGQPADHRADLFSLGVVIHEMIAGSRPFSGDSAVQTMNAILTEDPPDLVGLGRPLPPALAHVVRRCLEKNPEERFQSASDLAFALEALSTTSVGSSVGVEAPIDPPKRRLSLVPVLAAVAGLLLGAAGAAALLPSAGADLGRQTFSVVASDTAGELEPAWSPDGRSIAFVKFIDGRQQLFARQLDVDHAQQLTTMSTIVSAPFWWPDSSRIGFLSANGVWAVSLAGGTPELIQTGEDGAWISGAALSPDGNTLAVYRRDPETARTSIWTASPATGELVKLEPAPFEQDCCSGPNHLRFSPDGSELLFAHFAFYREGGEVVVWLVPLDGGAPREVLAGGPWAGVPEPSWMPDGRRVLMAFRRPDTPASDLWMADLASEVLTPVSVGFVDRRWPSVSPDGTRVAFVSGGPDFDLVEIPLDGSPVRDVLATSSDEYTGAWVPGSPQLVYVTEQSGQQQLRVRNVEDGTDRLIASGNDFPGANISISAPVASPDGQRVAYHVIGTGDASAVWISPIRGGTPTRLFVEDVLQISPAWSPDSQSIVYWRLGPDRGLSISRVGSTAPPVVLNQADTETIATWSPDGRWIAYRDEEGLKVVSPDGESRRLVTSTNGRTIVWSPDSATIYTRVSNPAALVAVDVATGNERVVRTLDDDFFFGVPTTPGQRFTISSSGDSILASAFRIRSDIWVLDGFER